MADYTVTLTADQIEAWKNMLAVADITAGLQAHCQAIAENHIAQRIKEEEEKKTLADRKSAITDFEINPS